MPTYVHDILYKKGKTQTYLTIHIYACTSSTCISLFFLPTDTNILEHVSGNTGIFFLSLYKNIFFTQQLYSLSTRSENSLTQLNFDSKTLNLTGNITDVLV
jgi:hypothetical protein